jgi:hypothetical protein
MNCREYQHQITLLMYQELPETERPGLEAHLHQCESCKHLYEEQEGMHVVLAEDAAAWDVPADLLVESRRALADQLDLMERKRPWWRIPTFSVVLTPMRMLESAALVAMGLAFGVYFSNQPVQQVAAPVGSIESPISIIPRNGSVSNLRIVSTNPVTGQIELAGEVVQQLRFQGTMEDDTVRRLLFSALSDASNPGSRLRSVEALSPEAEDESVEEALIHVLVYDDNPGVRLRALEALKRFVGEEHVQAAFMHALANDSNAGIRVGAIDALSQSSNAQLAQTVQELTREDDNAAVRAKVLQFVGMSK